MSSTTAPRGLPSELVARLDPLSPETRRRALRHLDVAARVCAGDPAVLAAVVDAVTRRATRSPSDAA